MSDQKQGWRHESSLETSNLWPKNILIQVVLLWSNGQTQPRRRPCSVISAEKWLLMSFPFLRYFFHFSGRQWSKLLHKRNRGNPQRYLQLLLILFETCFPRPNMSGSSPSYNFGPIKETHEMKIRICECARLQDHAYNIKNCNNFKTESLSHSVTCAWLFVTLWTVALQALSMEFSRQEY